MQDDIKNHLKMILKRIDKLSKESLLKQGYNSRTARLRLLAELVREQVDPLEIPTRVTSAQNT